MGRLFEGETKEAWKKEEWKRGKGTGSGSWVLLGWWWVK